LGRWIAFASDNKEARIKLLPLGANEGDVAHPGSKSSSDRQG